MILGVLNMPDRRCRCLGDARYIVYFVRGVQTKITIFPLNVSLIILQRQQGQQHISLRAHLCASMSANSHSHMHPETVRDVSREVRPHIKKVPHDERLRKHCSASAVHVECCERGWGQHRDAPHALPARSAARARQRVRLQQLSTAAAGEGLPAPPRERSTFHGFLGR